MNKPQNASLVAKLITIVIGLGCGYGFVRVGQNVVKQEAAIVSPAPPTRRSSSRRATSRPRVPLIESPPESLNTTHHFRANLNKDGRDLPAEITINLDTDLSTLIHIQCEGEEWNILRNEYLYVEQYLEKYKNRYQQIVFIDNRLNIYLVSGEVLSITFHVPPNLDAILQENAKVLNFFSFFY